MSVLFVAPFVLPGLLTSAPQEARPAHVALVRVHGNHTVPDEEVIAIADVEPGAAFEPGDAEAIEARLLRSGRFESAEVRVRYRSLDETGDVALVLVVREKRSVASRFMVAPIVSLSDEYGWTLGAMPALVDLGVEGSRVAFPASWGGTRQVRVESEWPLGDRVSRRAYFDVSRWRRENPHFDAPENRLELDGGFRARLGVMSLDVGGSASDVDFLGSSERVGTFHAGVALDTRVDPTIPGDAVYAGLDWRRLLFEADLRDDVQQVTIDLRGYKRLVGQTTLAAQAYYRFASGPLPPYEQPFIGGGATLRGYEAGRFIGNNAAIGTLELRVPLTTPLSFARAGVHAFVDTGAVHDDGTRLRKTRFHTGVGAGAFFRFAVIGVRVDVGFDLEGNTRWHIASGFKF